ncbi:MAG: methyl-accepting chemotaxis protein [Rhodocyclaceae bacterium]
MFKNMTVRNKLLLVFLVFALLLSTVAVLGLSGMGTANGGVAEIYKKRLIPISVAGKINDLMRQNNQLLLSLAIARSGGANSDKYLARVESNKSQIDKDVSILEALDMGEAESKIFGEWKSLRNEFVVKGVEPTIKLLRAGEYSDAEDVILGVTLPKYEKAQLTFERFVELQISAADNSEVVISNQYAVTRNVVIGGSVAGFVIILLIGMLLIRSINTPLKCLQETLAEVGESGDFSKRVPIDSGDEVGQTARAFNMLMDIQQKAISNVNGVVSAIAAGDFSRRVEADLKGDLQTMKVAVNTSAESVKVTMDGLNQLMKALYNGDFEQRLSVEVKGEFKIAVDQAAQAMRAMRAMLGDVGGVMAKVSDGDLSQRVTSEGRGDLERLKENINASLVSLSSVMKAVGQNTQQVAAASNQTSNAIGQISDGAQNQMHAIGQVSNAVQQTAAAVTEVARSAESANARAQGMGKAVNEGIADMNRMVEIVQAIATNADRIDKITDVIEKIANKTNLLSLNAAIEAARAGEHGKGFAVVAEEVGKLAASAAESTQEIAALVKQAVEDAERATGTVAVVNKGMQEISLGARQTEAELQRISAAMEQQNAAISEINANVGSLNRIASANASAAEEITSTVIELARLADGTRREVEKFST